jgi:hypothetical protein
MKAGIPQFNGRLEDVAKRDQKAQFPWDPEQAKLIETEGTALAKEIVEHCNGWPPISQVGEAFSDRLWLLVQHASSAPEFQEACLTMIEALLPGEVKPSHYALLKDQVLLHQNRSQIYGSQVYEIDHDSGTVYFAPIEDAQQVDERRAEMQLQPMNEYAKAFTPNFKELVILPPTRLRLSEEQLNRLTTESELIRTTSEGEMIYFDHSSSLIGIQIIKKIGKHHYKVAEGQYHLQAIDKFTEWAGEKANDMLNVASEHQITHIWDGTFATYHGRGYSHQIWNEGDKIIAQTPAPYLLIIDDSKNHWTTDQVQRRANEKSVEVLWSANVPTKKGDLPAFIYKVKQAV